jgi:peroxiredoxin
MRSDIQPGATFPDYELPDHDDKPRKLGEIQGDDPLILALARALLARRSTSSTSSWPPSVRKIAVAYTQLAMIATDEHQTLQEFWNSVGASVAVPLRPGPDRPEGPRDPGVHRSRERPDDPTPAAC